MLSLFAFIALVAGTGYFAPLDIQLTAPKARVLVGEPVRMSAKWATTQPLIVAPQHARVLVDRGAGFTVWTENGPMVEIMESVTTTSPASPAYSTHVIGVVA